MFPGQHCHSESVFENRRDALRRVRSFGGFGHDGAWPSDVDVGESNFQTDSQKCKHACSFRPALDAKQILVAAHQQPVAARHRTGIAFLAKFKASEFSVTVAGRDEIRDTFAAQ